MNDKIPKPPQGKEPKLDHALLIRELESFIDTLNSPITTKELKLWMEDNEERKYIAADTVWGTIRLPRTFGLPTTPLLASAFVIEHRMWEIRKTNPQTGAITYPLIVPTDPPQKWDGPHNEKYYRVSFMFYRSRGDKSEITVNFANNFSWVNEGVFARSVYREISPSVIELDHSKDRKPFFLSPFTVVEKRFFQ